jgi:hypothetical protein
MIYAIMIGLYAIRVLSKLTVALFTVHMHLSVGIHRNHLEDAELHLAAY